MFLFLSSLAMASQHPPQATINDALIADIPPEGFDSITELIPALLPSEIPVDPIGFGSSGAASIEISDLNVTLEVSDAGLVPKEGFLELDITIVVYLNSTASPFSLDTSLLWIPNSCEGYVNPFDAEILAQTFLTVSDLDGDGITELDVSVENLDFSYDLDGDAINLDGCALATVADILDFLGLNIYDLILDTAGPELEGAVYDLIPELEALIEDAFSQANINQVVDLNGIELTVALNPSDVDIKPEGMRLLFDGSFGTEEVADCINEYDPGGSLETIDGLPPIASTPNGITPGYHMGAIGSDDFINQALYSVWRGGLLCYRIDEETFPLDTGILNLLSGNVYIDLFPDTQAMFIITEPKMPPYLDMSTANDMGIQIEELGLSFYAELDHRQAKILTTDLATDVGVDLDLDDATGVLDILIDLDPNRIITTVSSNEFFPDLDGEIEDSFGEQLDTVIGLVDIEGMLGDLSFALPSIEGLGLIDLEITGSGNAGNDFGGYATLGVVPYAGGCGDEGTEESGCGGGGCSATASNNSRGYLMAVLFLGVLLRRKSSILE